MSFGIDTSSAGAFLGSATLVGLIWLAIIVVIGSLCLAAWAASYETYHTILALKRGQLIAAQASQENVIIAGGKKWLRPFLLLQFIIYWPDLADGLALIVEFSDVVAPGFLNIGAITAAIYYCAQAMRFTMIVALVACVYALVRDVLVKRRLVSEKFRSSSEMPSNRPVRIEQEKEQYQ